jgi:hypothetical protein
MGKISRSTLKDVQALRADVRPAPHEHMQTIYKCPWAERYGHVVVGTHFRSVRWARVPQGQRRNGEFHCIRVC